MNFILKSLVACLVLGIVGCRQAARPPLLSEAESKEVLRVLAKTDKLDRMARAGNPGKVFADLAREVEIEHLRSQATLPEKNAAVEEFRQVVNGYSVAGTLFSGGLQESRQNPTELVAESSVRKQILRRILTGQASEKDWQAFETGTKLGKQKANLSP